MNYIQKQQYDCLSDENLYLLATIPNSINTYEKAKSILRLQRRLHAVKSSVLTVDINGRPYLLANSKLTNQNFVFVGYTSEDEVFSKLRAFRTRFWIFTAVAVTIIFFFTLSTYRFIHKPLLKTFFMFLIQNSAKNLTSYTIYYMLIYS
jgi:hypothetical protein